MRSFIIVPVALVLAVSGCTSGMDSAECVTADWHAVGFEDGANGRGASAIASHRKACAKHGVSPNFEAYMAGRDRGLTQYCRPQNGYRLGTRGVQYYGVCPSAQEAEFQAAHADGYGLYSAPRNGFQGRQEAPETKRDRANRIERELVETTARLVGTGIAVSKRAAMGVKIKQLAEEKVEVAESIQRLEYEYAAAQEEYEEYRIAVAHRNRPAGR